MNSTGYYSYPVLSSSTVMCTFGTLSVTLTGTSTLVLLIALTDFSGQKCPKIRNFFGFGFGGDWALARRSLKAD